MPTTAKGEDSWTEKEDPWTEKEDPWTSFLREELIRVKTGANRANRQLIRDPESPSEQKHVETERDYDHETVMVNNKTKHVPVPPGTPETIKETPSSTPTHTPPHRPTRIIIDSSSTAQRPNFLSCLCQNKGIIIVVVLIFLLLTTGFGGFLLQKFLGIPSLNREISQLNTQVDRLKHENEVLQGNVKNLTIQVDRQAQLNRELANNTTFLQNQVNKTEGLLQVFNSSLAVKDQLNSQLQTQVIAYRESLTDANNTLLTLTILNNNLNNQVDVLDSTLDEYTLANNVLTTQVDNLTDSVFYLNDTVFQLNNTVDRLQNETVNLKDLNIQLGTVVSFLNITANQNDQVYKDFMGYLASQVTIYRGLVAMDLELYYRYFIDNWTADFTSRFGMFPFGMNDTIPFGSYYNAVITRIYNKDLGYLCIHRGDFEKYLSQEILPLGTDVSETNLQYLEEAVSTYSSKLFDFYFPTNSSTPYSVKISDWETATWDCNNLPLALQFSYEKYNNFTSTGG